MTREEFQLVAKQAIEYGRATVPVRLAYDQLVAHDAEQRAEIARLEEWKRIVMGTGTDMEAVIRMAAAEYTQTAIQCWKDKCEQQEREIARLREAPQIYKEASIQSHNGHWDATGNHGAGCPECIRARELRSKAERVLAQQAIKESKK